MAFRCTGSVRCPSMEILRSSSWGTPVLFEKVENDMLQLAQAELLPLNSSLLLLTFGMADFHVQLLVTPCWTSDQTVPHQVTLTNLLSRTQLISPCKSLTNCVRKYPDYLLLVGERHKRQFTGWTKRLQSHLTLKIIVTKIYMILLFWLLTRGQSCWTQAHNRTSQRSS